MLLGNGFFDGALRGALIGAVVGGVAGLVVALLMPAKKCPRCAAKLPKGMFSVAKECPACTCPIKWVKGQPQDADEGDDYDDAPRRRRPDRE